MLHLAHTAWGEMHTLQELLQNTLQTLSLDSKSLVQAIELPSSTGNAPTALSEIILSQGRKRVGDTLIQEANRLREQLFNYQTERIEKVKLLTERGWRVMGAEDGSGQWLVDVSADQLCRPLLPKQFPNAISVERSVEDKSLYTVTLDGIPLQIPIYNEELLMSNLLSSISLCIWKGILQVIERLSAKAMVFIERPDPLEVIVCRFNDHKSTRLCLITSSLSSMGGVDCGNKSLRGRILLKHCLQTNFTFKPSEDETFLEILFTSPLRESS